MTRNENIASFVKSNQSIKSPKNSNDTSPTKGVAQTNYPITLGTYKLDDLGNMIQEEDSDTNEFASSSVGNSFNTKYGNCISHTFTSSLFF